MTVLERLYEYLGDDAEMVKKWIETGRVDVPREEALGLLRGTLSL